MLSRSGCVLLAFVTVVASCGSDKKAADGSTPPAAITVATNTDDATAPTKVTLTRDDVEGLPTIVSGGKLRKDYVSLEHVIPFGIEGTDPDGVQSVGIVVRTLESCSPGSTKVLDKAHFIEDAIPAPFPAVGEPTRSMLYNVGQYLAPSTPDCAIVVVVCAKVVNFHGTALMTPAWRIIFGTEDKHPGLNGLDCVESNVPPYVVPVGATSNGGTTIPPNTTPVTCACSAVGAWAAPKGLITTRPLTAPAGGSTVAQSGGQDQLKATDGKTLLGPWFDRGSDGTGNHVGLESLWAWSPDGKFFAVAVRDKSGSSGGSWTVQVAATTSYDSWDGQTKPAGAVGTTIGGSSTASDVIAPQNLGWNAPSTCLVLALPPASAGASVGQFDVICPYASPVVASETLTAAEKATFVFSPCGGVLAIIPAYVSGASSTPNQLKLRDLRNKFKPITPMLNGQPAGEIYSTATDAGLNTTATGNGGIALTGMTQNAIDAVPC